jgi:hypothetical protein
MNSLTSILFARQINAQKIATDEDAQKSHLLLLLVTRLALAAIHKFLARNFRAFDALVGETACQLRASRVQILAMDPDFRTRITELKDAIDKTLARLQENGLRPERNLEQARFFETTANSAGGFKLSKEEQFLILSHLLCITRDRSNPSETNESNMSQFLKEGEQETEFPSYSVTVTDPDTGKLKSRSLTTYQLIGMKAKRELSALSVAFIQRIAKQQGIVPELMLSQKNLINALDLTVAPCYFSIEILLRDVLESKRMIVLKIMNADQKKVILPLISRDGKQFTLCDDRPDEVAIVFDSTAADAPDTDEYKRKLLGSSDGTEDYPHSRIAGHLLAQAAAHPQYAGPRKNASIPTVASCEDIAKQLPSSLNPLRSKVSDVDRTMKDIAKDKSAFDYECERLQLQHGKVPIQEIIHAKLRMDALRGRVEESPFVIRHIYCSVVREVV